MQKRLPLSRDTQIRAELSEIVYQSETDFGVTWQGESLLQNIVSFIGLFCKRDLWNMCWTFWDILPEWDWLCVYVAVEILKRQLATKSGMGWLRLVGSLKSQVSFAECCLFYRAFLQKRPIILRSLLIVATPSHIHKKLELTFGEISPGWDRLGVYVDVEKPRCRCALLQAPHAYLWEG